MLRYSHVENTTRIVKKQQCTLNFAFKLINIRNLRNSKLGQMNIQNLRFVNLTNLFYLKNYHFHSQSAVTKLASIEVLELHSWISCLQTELGSSCREKISLSCTKKKWAWRICRCGGKWWWSCWAYPFTLVKGHVYVFKID